MGKVKTIYISTRRFDGDDPVKTKITIDASGLTEDDMMEYVIDSAVIKWQGAIRRKKDATVPTEATYVVPKPGTRAPIAMTEDQMIDALSKKFGDNPDALVAELKRRAALAGK